MNARPDWLQLQRGDAPLLLSLPHTGTRIPDEIAASLVSPALARVDTDWWVHRLYGFAKDLGATLLRTDISRSAIDVNRDPSGASLYPGQFTTGLCPVQTFDGRALYRLGAEPDTAELARRRRQYFEPYHETLAAELLRLRARHPRVVLYDAHSIRAVVPSLFQGRLPDFNLGSYGGRSADAELLQRIRQAVAGAPYTQVVNGRFQGGWITRHYGCPEQGIHAVQMELAQAAYMRESQDLDAPELPPFDEVFALPLQQRLRAALQAALAWASLSSAPRAPSPARGEGTSRHGK